MDWVYILYKPAAFHVTKTTITNHERKMNS